MVRFTPTARTSRRSPPADPLHNGRRLLRRLMDENVLLMRELDELRGLREVSHQDPLTGLPNRRLFDQRLARELSRCARGPTSQKGALLAVDVNDLKVAEDRFGHAVGAQVPRDVADVVRGALRQSDVCCRTEGDAFMILLPDTDLQGARLVMARLRVAVIRAGSRQNVPISISIGCAVWPTDSREADQLIAKADRGMRAEKRRLRGRARERPPKAGAKLTLVSLAMVK